MHYEALTHVICHLMPFEAALKQCLLCKARYKNKGDFKMCYIYTLKKCWVVSTQTWVEYWQTQMLG